MRILIAEDDERLLKSLKYILEKNEYIVDGVTNGKDAFDYAMEGNYDAIVFDVMMPEMDGFQALKMLREKRVTTPVMFLTAKTQVEDRIEGLDIGADDYLTKPFATEELLARIRAMLRRKDSFSHDIVLYEDLVINRSTYEVKCNEKSCILSGKEFGLLDMLVANAGGIVSSETFMIKLWGYETDVDVSVIWTHISNLRKKLNELETAVNIKFVRGVGYTLRSEK